MKRKLWVVFATIVAALALAFGISACSPLAQLPTQPQPLGTPVVSISDEGIASWEPVVHAVGYSYLIDDDAEVSTTAHTVQLEDGQTIQVKATGDGYLYLDSAFSKPATYHKEPVPELTQLATPVVSIDKEGLATWEAVPNASGYQYKLNGGEENTLESDAELQVQLQDKDSIQVKAVGDGETYSDSEYSEAKAYTAPVKPQIIKIETPVVTIDGDGTAHWEAVAHASAYFYKIDGEDEIRTTTTSKKLQDGQTISVKACTEEEGYEDSDYSEPVKYTAPVTPPQPTQLATPEVTINEEGLATWTEVAHASSYKYKINGGEEKTIESGAELQVQLEDKQYIEVKAVGNGETYSDSPYSAAKTYNAPAKPEPTRLTTPEVTIDEAGLATWEAVPNASGYKYKISGGEETTLVGAELQVQLEDKQYIEVKAVGDGETYSDSPYSAAKTYNAPAKPEPTQLATPEVTINEEGLATWERVENATGYVCKVGGEEQEVQTELSIQLQSGDTLQVKAVSTDTEHFTESAYSDLQTYTKQPVEEKEKLLASLTFGAPYNESDKHVGDYTSKWTATRDGVTWDIENFNNNNNNEKWFFVKIGSKSADTRGTITTQTPFAEAISKVVISVDAKSLTSKFSFVKEFVLQISDTSDFSNSTTVSPTESIHVGDNEFVIAEPVANRYYRIVIDCEACGGNDNGIVAVSAVNYWGEAVPELTKLDAPTLNVDSHTGDVTWEKVEGATSYTYTIDGENETTVGKDDELKVTLKNNQTITVIAKGDGTTYADSDPATQQYVHEHAYKTENNGWENDSDEGHYKKCTYCQEETEKIGHTYENGVCTECQYAHTDHKYSEEKPGECTVCGKAHEHAPENLEWTRHDETGHTQTCKVCHAEVVKSDTHTYGEGYTEEGEQHYQTCECGYKNYSAHTYMDGVYESENDAGHYQVCTACSHHTETASHTLSYVADEENGHHQKCSACDYVTQSTAHNYAKKQYGKDETDHWQICDDCGKEGEHEGHNSAGWGKDQNNHWTICSVCGGNEGEHTPHEFKTQGDASEEKCDCGMEKNHVHVLEWYTSDTEHWQKCKNCDHVEGRAAHTGWTEWVDGGAQHRHTTTCTEHADSQVTVSEDHHMTKVGADDDNHWKECAECAHKEDETPHTWGAWSPSDEGHTRTSTCEGHEEKTQTAAHNPAQVWDYTGETHVKKCTDCQAIVESHEANYQWTTRDNEGTTLHEYKCEACGDVKYSHEQTDEHMVWVTTDEANHWKKCTGATDDQVPCTITTENGTHTHNHYEEVAENDEQHNDVCACGKVIGQENHVYNTDEGDGICTKCEHAHEGHAYNKEAKDGKCTTCGKEHVHTETLEWTKTDDTHKQYCTECGFETVPEVAHDYTKQTGSCDVCGKAHENHEYGGEPDYKCECGATDPDAPKEGEIVLTADSLGVDGTSGYNGANNNKSIEIDKVTFKYAKTIKSSDTGHIGDIQGKNGTATFLENTTAFRGRIISIEIGFKSSSGTITFAVGATASSLTTQSVSMTKTFTYKAPDGTDYRYFKLSSPVSSNVYISSITITYMDEGKGGEKIDEEFAKIEDTITIEKAGTKDLPTPQTHLDVKFDWKVDDEQYAKYLTEDGKINVTELPVEEDVTVTLTLTATRCVTKTKTVTVKIIGRALNKDEWNTRYTDEVKTEIEGQFSNKQLESNLTLTMPEAKNVSYKVESNNETAVTVSGSEKSFTLELNRSYKEDQEAKITVTVTYTYKEVTYKETLIFDITVVGMTRENLEDDYTTAFTQLGLTEETLTLVEGDQKTYTFTNTLDGLLTLEVTLEGEGGILTVKDQTTTGFTLKADKASEQTVTLKVTLKYAGKLGSSDQASKEKTFTVQVTSKIEAEEKKLNDALSEIKEAFPRSIKEKHTIDLSPLDGIIDDQSIYLLEITAGAEYASVDEDTKLITVLKRDGIDQEVTLTISVVLDDGADAQISIPFKVEAITAQEIEDWLKAALAQAPEIPSELQERAIFTPDFPEFENITFTFESDNPDVIEAEGTGLMVWGNVGQSANITVKVTYTGPAPVGAETTKTSEKHLVTIVTEKSDDEIVGSLLADVKRDFKDYIADGATEEGATLKTGSYVLPAPDLAGYNESLFTIEWKVDGTDASVASINSEPPYKLTIEQRLKEVKFSLTVSISYNTGRQEHTFTITVPVDENLVAENAVKDALDKLHTKLTENGLDDKAELDSEEGVYTFTLDELTDITYKVEMTAPQNKEGFSAKFDGNTFTLNVVRGDADVDVELKFTIFYKENQEIQVEGNPFTLTLTVPAHVPDFVEETLTTTITNKSTGFKTSTGTTTVTEGGFSYQTTLYLKNSGIYASEASSSSSTIYLYNTTEFNDSILSVTVNYGTSATSTSAVIKCYFGDAEKPTQNEIKHTNDNKQDDPAVFTAPEGKNHKFFQLIFTTKQQFLGTIVITYKKVTANTDQGKATLAAKAITLDKTELSKEGDFIELPATGEYDATITWAMQPESSGYVTRAENKLTVTKLPTESDETVTLTATATVNGKTAQSTPFTITIAKEGSAVTWTKVTQADQVVEGKKVVFVYVDEGVVSGALSGDYLACATGKVVFSSDKKTITELQDPVAWTLQKDETHWKFLNSKGEALGATAAKKLALNQGTTTWDISVSAGSTTVTSTTKTYGTMYYNAGSPRFTTYTTTSQKTIFLYVES